MLFKCDYWVFGIILLIVPAHFAAKRPIYNIKLTWRCSKISRYNQQYDVKHSIITFKWHWKAYSWSHWSALFKYTNSYAYHWLYQNISLHYSSSGPILMNTNLCIHWIFMFDTANLVMSIDDEIYSLDQYISNWYYIW